MVEASQHCVEMAELQARASEIIAEITGAEAGLVTAGAAAGLLLGTAACVTGLDAGRMNRLPDTARHGERDRHRAQPAQLLRPHDPRGRRAAGRGRPARSLCRGRRARRRGLGDRRCARPSAPPPCTGSPARTPGRALEQVVEVAHAAGVPVLVDAAAQLPPAANLRRFIEAGADLVAFSGGKAIGGPQASGILCGRRYLDHGRRAAEPRSRRVLRAVGAACRTSSTRRGSKACRSTASAAAARSARRRSSAC